MIKMLNENDYDNVIKNTLTSAYARSSFYRWFYKQHNIDVHSIRGLQDYDSLPILRKEDILSFAKMHNIEESWCVPSSKDLVVVTTTGTTGRRLKVPFTQMDMDKLVKPGLDCLRWWGYDNGPINVLLWEYPKDSIASIWLDRLARETGGRVYLDGEVEEEVFFQYKSIRPGILTYINLPRLSKLLNPSGRIQELKKLNLKYIFTLVTPSELKTKFHIKISKELESINLIPIYAFTEGAFIGASCPYTFNDAYIHVTHPGLFHIVDSNGFLQNEGRGELIYTSLGREAFPFIKYSTGDIVTLIKEHGCRCGYSGQNLRFETRRALTVKIQYPDSYLVDIVKVAERIKEIIPESQIMCVYGEHPYEHYLFLAIFIGISKSLTRNERELKDKIIENIILDHMPVDKINSIGLSNLVLEWRTIFPIFLIDVDDIPIEAGANKPKLLLNLTDEENILKLNCYQKILSKLEGYWCRR